MINNQKLIKVLFCAQQVHCIYQQDEKGCVVCVCMGVAGIDFRVCIYIYIHVLVKWSHTTISHQWVYSWKYVIDNTVYPQFIVI